jgi:phospholipase C
LQRKLSGPAAPQRMSAHTSSQPTSAERILVRQACASVTILRAAGKVAAALFLLSCLRSATVSPAGEKPPAEAGQKGLEKLDHIVVVYLENRSFDNLYGEFQGAEGLESANARRYLQLDSTGKPFTVLPQATGSGVPKDLPNAPFPIERYIPSNHATIDLVHRFYHEKAQIHDGRMDRFVLVSDAEGLVMGFYHTANLPLATEARQYTLWRQLLPRGLRRLVPQSFLADSCPDSDFSASAQSNGGPGGLRRPAAEGRHCYA